MLPPVADDVAEFDVVSFINLARELEDLLTQISHVVTGIGSSTLLTQQPSAGLSPAANYMSGTWKERTSTQGKTATT
jgi:hypothetical protein